MELALVVKELNCLHGTGVGRTGAVLFTWNWRWSYMSCIVYMELVLVVQELDCLHGTGAGRKGAVLFTWNWRWS